MPGRILRTELRRSAAPVAGALTAALGAAGLYALLLSGQSALWDAQWTTLAGFQRVMLVLLWPLALGAGAWQARRDRRSRMEELLGSVSRPEWQRPLPAAVALATFLVVGYALVFAAGAVRVASTASYPTSSWLPMFAVGALSLVAAGWIGIGTGRLLPSPYTPPILVVAGFLLLITPIQLAKGSAEGPSTLLAPNLTDTVDEFSTVSSAFSVAQAVWFTGLALGGLVLLLARRRAAPTALLPAALAGVLALSLGGSAPASGIVPNPAARAEVCTDDGGPRVCVTRAHQDGLAELIGPARRALRLMDRLPNPPTSVHEVPSGTPGPQPADELWLDSDNYETGHGWRNSARGELLMRLLAGAGTRPCDHSDYRTRAIAAAWLIGHYPPPGTADVQKQEAAERRTLWKALRALPRSEQTRRIAEIRRIGLTCGDVSTVLPGTSS